MYLLLLVFGGALTAAGIALAASGVSIHERIFDATIVTPGVVAAVGGVLLIGLGLALRVLQRIEQALALRPMSRAAQPGAPAEPVATAERPSQPPRIPFPSKNTIRPHAAAVAALAPEAAGGEKRAEELPEKSLAGAPFETMRGNEESEALLSPRSLSSFVPSRVDEAVAEADRARARRRNGGAPTRMNPRLDLSPRSPIAAERAPGPTFDSLWPKGPRPTRAAPAAPVQPAAAPGPAPEPTDAPAPEDTTAAQDEAPPQVSVLKSGVVDGMAYTLYSDGSIEAQLPQGTLRFGSITELRNHIEQTA